MQISKKLKIILIIAFVATLAVGIVAGFVMGIISKNGVNKISELFQKKQIYQSRCTLYISSDGVPGDIYAEDASTSVQLPEPVLQFDNIYAVIDQKYPHTEYTLTLEQIENSNLYTITVTGESQDNLYEICKLAASLLAKEVSDNMEGVVCNIVDPPSQPSLSDD